MHVFPSYRSLTPHSLFLLSHHAALRGEETNSELKSTSRVLKGPPGSPEGKKVFNFNMVGHPKDSTIPSCDNNGKRIFVESSKQTKVEVYQDTSGYDIDCDDGNGGTNYALSVPTVGTFDVYVRILGKPGGTLDIKACDLNETGDCLLDTFSITRKAGKSSFTVATSKLFSDEYDNILWTVDANNFKVAQFWFYEL